MFKKGEKIVLDGFVELEVSTVSCEKPRNMKLK